MELFPQHSWHPMVIHFPLVGLLVAACLDAVAARTRSPRWREAATLFWWLGLLGAVAALVTGLVAYTRVDHSEAAHLRMTLHRNVAFGVVALLIAAALWRRRRPYSLGAALLASLGAIGLLGAGYLGGELVYRHGVGIPTVVLQSVMSERGGHVHGGSEGHSHGTGQADSGEEDHQHPAPTDSGH